MVYKKKSSWQTSWQEDFYQKWLLRILFFEKVLNFFIRNHLLIKDISTSLRRLNHLDNLCISTTFLRTFVQTCYCFLCHGLYVLFDFFVYCHSLQDRIVLLQFQSLSGVLSVLRRDVTRSTRHTTIFVFCAFQNYLHSVTFSFLCHILNLLFFNQLL